MSEIGKAIAIKDKPYLEMLCDRIYACRCDVDRNTQRIHEITDRLVGTLPKESLDKTDTPIHIGIHNTDFNMDCMQNAINQLANALDRLEEVNLI